MSKRITKRNLGGVSLTSTKKDLPKQEIIDDFLQNSDFRILTDTSVSCVNYVATLRPDKESPFFSVRSGHFREPVRSLLMKVCIHSVEKQFVTDFRNNNPKPIETMTPENINSEAKIQDDIFRKSYIENIAEPICPAILYVQNDIETDIRKNYYDWINVRLIERNPNENPGRDHHNTNILFNTYRISIIFMEVAEGYYSLFDLWVHPQNQGPNELLILQNLLFIAMYELYQLYHKYGIVHGDIHFGNILVNPSYNSNPNGGSPGKALLIDFGKSFYETPDPNKQEYDTIIYHQNTHQFENLLQGLPNKNDFFRNNFKDTTELRKKNTQAFLDRLFGGSIERWREWSKNNIHFPYNDYQVGGLLHNKRKSLLSKQKQTKTIAYNMKKKNMEKKFEFDPRHHLPETAFRITQETANQHAAELKKLLIQLEQNPPPKVAPASPRTAARDKKFIADALNSPLDIEHNNSYSLPSIIAATKEKQEKAEKKRRTRAKRNTF
jgi:hypothetical protein